MTTIKFGYLTYFKKGFLYKKWKIGYFVLYSKSTQLLWFNSKEDPSPEGCIIIGNVAKYIVFGEATKYLPKRPEAENPDFLIAIPRNIERKIGEVLWIYCNDSNLFEEWKEAINNSLSKDPSAIQMDNLQVDNLKEALDLQPRSQKPRPPKPKPPTKPRTILKVYPLKSNLSKSLPSTLNFEAIKTKKLEVFESESVMF